VIASVATVVAGRPSLVAPFPVPSATLGVKIGSGGLSRLIVVHSLVVHGAVAGAQRAGSITSLAG
jgi:hypothetical protein